MPSVRPLVVIPTYNESENIERMLHRAPSPCPKPGSWWSTTAVPTARAIWSEAVAAERPDVHLLAPAGQSPDWGAPTGPDSPGASSGGTTPSSRWTPTSPTTRVPCRSWSRPSTTASMCRSGRATSPGGSIPNWAWHRELLSRGGNLYATRVLGLGVADSTAGFRAYSARILRRLDLEPIRAEGYGFQIEMTYRRQAARRVDHRGADQLRRPGGGRVEDVLLHRGRGASAW